MSEECHHIPRSRIYFTYMEEICIFASELSNVQSLGMDWIPNEFYKVAPGLNYAWLSDFINCALSYSFLPSTLTDVEVTPILRSSLKDSVVANDYRLPRF